jgi:hypothetical protein
VLALIGYLLALAGASALLLLQDWRRRLLAFLLQSTGVGLLAGTLAPAGVAAVEVLSGWLVGVTIALSVLRARPRLTQESMASASRLFRGLALLMILVAIASLMPDIGSLLGDPPRQITLAAGTLAGTGFLILGLTEHPLTTGLGLVTVLQGLELAYLWSERSLLVVALLAVVNLAVALACTYLHAVESQGRSREEAG